MAVYDLPTALEVDGILRDINSDYRAILNIIRELTDESLPEPLRWITACALFYKDDPEPSEDAMDQLAAFISEDTGDQDRSSAHPGPQLMDWQQDFKMIIAGVNQVAGCEVRALPYLHWWTFLSYYRSIGEGQLSTVVGIRQKLAKRQKLDQWEQEYYTENKDIVDIRKPLTAEEEADKDRYRRIVGIR